MTYKERRERKANRLREWADRRDEKAQLALDGSQQATAGIEFGQPILVGHHSERRHRNAIERADRALGRAVEHSHRADEFRSRASNIERAADSAIYCDDLDATARLREKVAGLEARRDRIKRYNATCRKGQPDVAILEDDEQREMAQAIEVWGDVQCKGARFPSYVTSNLTGNIARLRKRLAALES